MLSRPPSIFIAFSLIVSWSTQPAVQPQAVLLTVRELLGYVVLAGLGILLFVLLTRMRPLNHRRLVAWRRRWRGQPAISLEGL